MKSMHLGVGSELFCPIPSFNAAVLSSEHNPFEAPRAGVRRRLGREAARTAGSAV